MTRRFRALLLIIGAAAPLWLHAQTPAELRADVETMWRVVGDRYAYFDVRATRWPELPRLYAEALARLSTRDEMVALLEQMLDELVDPHAQLNVNLATSPRLVPSGTDLWAAWLAGDAVVTDVRVGSDAEKAGIRPNDVVLRLGDLQIGAAVEARLGRSYPHSDAPARDWALRAVLAGRHGVSRALQLRRGDAIRTVELPARDQFGARPAGPLAVARLPGRIGQVRLNDSLGDDATIAAFDAALDALRDTRALIVDLRDTPSGGNSTVARAILGRFVARDLPYQRHLLPAEERETGVRRSWLELVSPRGVAPYRGRVVVLVGHWTGSMGEGLAIGFDATRAGTVIGTRMAGLLGATDQVVLPHTGIGINLPTERLYHVDGTPREAFQPTVLVDVAHASPRGDPFVQAALRWLARPAKRARPVPQM
jgi:carboxyl-terminal processing protease